MLGPAGLFRPMLSDIAGASVLSAATAPEWDACAPAAATEALPVAEAPGFLLCLC